MSKVRLDKKSRKFLFKHLKKIKGCNKYKELAKKLNISYGGLQSWMYGENYTPQEIIPKNLIKNLKILDEQEDNWGTKKGGKKAYKILKRKYKNELENWHTIGGKHAIKKLRKWIKNNPKEFIKRLRKGKYLKTKKIIEKKTKEYNNYFENNKVEFNIKNLVYSYYDHKRNIKIPRILTPDLAEEIGIHCGDGTLPNKKYYFSVRGDKKEKDYYTKFILNLYKKLYNLDLKPTDRGKTFGIEFGSKAIYTFKNQILGLPIGKKINRIDIPECIMKCQDRSIIQAFIRGVFDTDGCITFIKKRNYPIINIKIISKEFMNNLKILLEKLGFIPRLYNNNMIIINGPIQLEKWYKEIGSSNPKHLNKIINYLNNPSCPLSLVDSKYNYPQRT